jgi:signal transduction histidine kinase
VRNLISNARRYGGGHIAVDVERNADVVTVTVIDDGPGVPDNREEAIFEAYERGHAQPTQPGSVGLGLAVSRELARMMGGDVTFERRDSKTRFAFAVPAFREKRPSSDPEGTPGAAAVSVDVA